MNNFENLKNLPRYTPGHIELGGLSIRYNDPLALYNEYKDIFIRRIYEFTPVQASPVIIDAGGYIGLSTLYFKTRFPNARVTVFEPDPTIGQILLANITANHITDTTYINAGVGSKAGKFQFSPDGADGGTVLAHIHHNPIKIDIVKLSDFINSPVDLLKMNIEGMEGDVFDEIEDILALIDQIIFEYHAFYNFPQKLGHILNLLDRHQFRYLVADVPCVATPLSFKLTPEYKQFNLVYAKRIKP